METQTHADGMLVSRDRDAIADSGPLTESDVYAGVGGVKGGAVWCRVSE